MKPMVLLSSLVLVACGNPSSKTYEQQRTSKIPKQFHGTWALDSSACSKTKPFPYIRLEADAYLVPEPPYSKEPDRFPVQNVVIDRTNERRLTATFPSAAIKGERSEMAMELSEDGKMMRWHEKGAFKITALYRCD